MYQIITLYVLNLHNVISKQSWNKRGFPFKKKKEDEYHQESDRATHRMETVFATRYPIRDLYLEYIKKFYNSIMKTTKF